VIEGLRIQILLVGRPEMSSIIRGKLIKSPIETIEVSNGVNSKDIRKFSEARYDEVIKIPKKFKTLREKVVATLADRATECFYG
jgi:hypothetical protein